VDLGLEGRVALVTGASKGIALGIARELVAEGASVAISSRSQARIEAAASSIGARGFVHDSSDLAAVPGLLTGVEQALGPVDVLVLSTGGPAAGPDALGFGRDEWRAAYEELVLAPMALVEGVVPGMRARGWGRVVAVSSSAVREPLPNIMLSNTHRSALLAGMKTLARQLAGDGVTLNSVLPGRILTDRLVAGAGSREEAERAAAEEVPAGRPGSVEEIAGVAAFLCSARASYVTGVALLVDGGLTRSV
jgi:3-oxoacyl-[acyl-carrier protein] reductase